MVPLAKPTIISITVLKLIECWNSYVWPRLITTKKEYFLVSNAIEYIKSNGFGRENIPAMMAAVTIVSIPNVLAYSISSFPVIPQSTVIIRVYFSCAIFSIASLFKPYPSFSLFGI